MRLPSLDNCGLKYGADKASNHHGLLKFYERFLREIRLTAEAVMEVGVNAGASVRMWEEYFPSARIIGTDSKPECLSAAGGRITVELMDEGDSLAIVDLGRRHGPFDLIVDDGSHMWEHQHNLFHYLYPFVRPGGYYILEDLDTSFGGYVEHFQGAATRSPAAFLHTFSDLLIGDTMIRVDLIEDAFLKSAVKATEFVAFHKRTAILRRKP